MSTIDYKTVERLARLLVETTEDARQLVAAGQTGELLRHRVKLAAALAAELGRVLKLVERDSERVNKAAVLAHQAICRARGT